MGKWWLFLVVAGLLGGAAGILPSLAAGDPTPSASFTAVDYSWNADGGGHQVTIQQGQTVSFGYPSGASAHNADFSGGSAPSVCSQTAGVSSGAVPPLPHSPTAQGWSGTCTFNTPGTYNFHCDLHASMTGMIVVQGPGGTTGTTTTPPTTTTTTATTPTTTTTITTTTIPGGSPSSAAKPKISLSRRQRGRRISGSVAVPAAYAGGTLQADAFQGRMRVGHLVKRLSEGTLSFSVQVRVKGHRKLTLMVALLVRAPGQPSKSSRLRVVLQS